MGALLVCLVIFIVLAYLGKLHSESKKAEEINEVDDIQLVVKFGEIKNGGFIEFQEKPKVVSWPEWENNDFSATDEVRGRHAKPGSYDESYFINPKTGKFKLPKYKHQSRFMVEIDDETDYKDSFLSDCDDKYDRDHYGMMDFENDAEYMIYLIVDGFSVIFEKKHKKKLGKYNQFSEHYDYIERYFYIESEPKIKENKRLSDQFLVDHGYLIEKEEIVDQEKAKKIMFRMLVKELTLLCNQYDIKHGKKADMIEGLLNLGYVPEQFKSVTVSQKFTEAIEVLADIYINDIKANLEGFHPSYIPFAWEAILVENSEILGDEEMSVFENKIHKVIGSCYWRKKFI